MQSFRSPAASGLLFGIAPKSNQKGLAPDAVVRFASCESDCPALLAAAGWLRQYIPVLLRQRGDPSPRPFGLFPPHARRATGGPVWAASCRRSKCKSSGAQLSRLDANVSPTQCRDARIRGSGAPFAVPSIAGVADQARRGAAMDRRAYAAVHGRTVCATPQRREAQGSSIRTMRIEPPRWAPSLLVTFGQCQK